MFHLPADTLETITWCKESFIDLILISFDFHLRDFASVLIAKQWWKTTWKCPIANNTRVLLFQVLKKWAQKLRPSPKLEPPQTLPKSKSKKLGPSPLKGRINNETQLLRGVSWCCGNHCDSLYFCSSSFVCFPLRYWWSCPPGGQGACSPGYFLKLGLLKSLEMHLKLPNMMKIYHWKTPMIKVQSLWPWN